MVSLVIHISVYAMINTLKMQSNKVSAINKKYSTNKQYRDLQNNK